jgi:transcriptional regulatory protein LevR
MDQNWKVVFTVTELHLSEMAKQMLNDNNIEAIIMNKVDSAYPSIGHVEVLVKEDDQEKAEQLLKEFVI